MVLEINDQNFENEVTKSDIPVVVDFWASWCGPCRMLGPVIEKVSGNYTGKVKFCKINVDENQVSAGKFGVKSIPIVIYFKGGSKKDVSVGALPENAIRSKVEALLKMS